MKQIGLFGGSFDPIHKGHIKLALECINQLNLDEVWFILAYDQPLKEGHYESFENRLDLIEVAIKDYPQLKVIDIERKLSKPSYSYHTTLALKEQYDHNFVWIIGSDNLKSLDQWYRIEDLKELLEFVVVRRNQEVVENYRVVDFDDEASSTAIRMGMFKYLDEAVCDEIYRKHLYMKTILYNNLSVKRADHVMRCVDVGLEIARYHNFDMTKVYQAIVLHDITKELDKDLELELMKKHFEEDLHYHHKVYHQFTGSYIAKHQFMIEDEDVLKAIKHHTTGTDDAPLSQLVFIADKVERGRPYPVEDYIELAKKDLKKAFIKIKDDANKHRKEGK